MMLLLWDIKSKVVLSKMSIILFYLTLLVLCTKMRLLPVVLSRESAN